MTPRRTWSVYQWSRAIQIIRDEDGSYWYLQWRWPFVKFYVCRHVTGSVR